MGSPSVYTGSRGRNEQHFTSPVASTTTRHQTQVKNLPQTGYGYNANTAYPTKVAYQAPLPQPQVHVHSHVQPKVQVLQSVPVQTHRYTHQPSLFSRFSPFTFFSTPTVVSNPAVVVTGPPVARVWTHIPASLLASSISIGLLAAALFTFGVIAVDPILLILGSILAVASGAGIIRATNK